MSSKNKIKLLDEVRAAMRLKHYSSHSEQAYCEWITRYVLFHKMTSPDDQAGGEENVEQF